MTPPVRGPRTYGLRTAVARPIRLAAIALALGIAAASLAVGAIVVASTAAIVGPTRLATALTTILAPYQGAILAIVAIGATLLAAMLLQLDQSERRAEITVLRANGWDSGRIGRMVAMHRAAIGAPAILVAVLVAVALGGAMGTASPDVLIGSAAAIVVVSLLLEVRWATRWMH